MKATLQFAVQSMKAKATKTEALSTESNKGTHKIKLVVAFTMVKPPEFLLKSSSKFSIFGVWCLLRSMVFLQILDFPFHKFEHEIIGVPWAFKVGVTFWA